MRRGIAFLFFLISIVWVQAQTTRVLFIGNSYTSVNDLPNLVSQIYTAAGETLDYSMSAPGGCTFQQHCSASLPYIQQGGWDYVVLQEQSQLPSFPISQFMQESYPYAQELCSLIRQYNPDAKIVFYMTWGRKNGDSQNGQYYPPLNTYEGMDSLLYARYLMMAEDNEACVSPVGAVWHQIRDQYPHVELYQSDGSHPSYLGSYVAACSFYTTFTSRNPLDIQWNGTLDGNMADIAKNAVKRVVYDSLSKWCFEEDTLPQDSTSIIVWNNQSLSVYPNPANTTLNIRTSDLTETASLQILDMKGAVVYEQSGISSDERLDVSAIPNGNYLLSVRVGTRRYTKVITISHSL